MSHDTLLRPSARLFDHLVGAGDPLWRRRGERLPFFDDIHRVQLDWLVHCAFIVHGTVRKRDGLPGVQDLFRPAVHVQPEVTLDDLAHDHTGMVMAPGLETGGDLYWDPQEGTCDKTSCVS